MSRVSSAAMHNICPTTRVPSLPFLFRSKDHLHKVLDGGDRRPDAAQAAKSAGFVGLAWYDSGSRSMYTRNKPVKTRGRHQGPEDPRAAVRPVGRDGGGHGRQRHAHAHGRGLHRLKTGLVDAAENNFPSYESAHHYEVAKYYSLTEHSMTPEMLMFSKRQWDKLPPDDQKILREAARESVPYMRKLWDEREAKSRAHRRAGRCARCSRSIRPRSRR